jgi:hypothetical protein
MQMENIFNLKIFYDFFWTPLGSRVSIWFLKNFKFILSCQQFDTVDTGVVDTAVVHLDLRISLRIFEKIRNGLNGIPWGWGETDS